MWEKERRTPSVQLEQVILGLRRCRRCCRASQGSVRPQLLTTPQAFDGPSQGREAGGRRDVCGQELAPVLGTAAPPPPPAGWSSPPSMLSLPWLDGLPATPLSCNLSFDNPALELPRFPPCPVPRARVTSSKNKRQQRAQEQGSGLGSHVCRRWSPAQFSPKEN